jgi:hypothetical protein
MGTHCDRDRSRDCGRDTSAPRGASPAADGRRRRHTSSSSRHRKRRRRDASSDSSSGSDAELVREAKRFLKAEIKKGRLAPREAAAAAAALAGPPPPPPPRAPPAPPRPLPPGTAVISFDDHYFIRNPEFAVWLREARGGLLFGDLASADARALFAEFAAEWNAGRLPPALYAAARAADTGGGAAPPTRSSHQWAFSGAGAGAGAKAERARGQAWLDEMLPNAVGGGREAAQEKKAARRADGAAAEAAKDDFAFAGDVMGCGDDFAAARRQEAARTARRDAARAAKGAVLDGRLAAAREKEEERMVSSAASLSCQSKQKTANQRTNHSPTSTRNDIAVGLQEAARAPGRDDHDPAAAAGRGVANGRGARERAASVVCRRSAFGECVECVCSLKPSF